MCNVRMKAHGARSVVAFACIAFALLTTAAEATTQTVVLLGEKPRVREGMRTSMVTNLVEMTSAVLKWRVVDMTVEKEGAHATAQRAIKAISMKPAAVVVFTGLADQEAGIADESVRKELVSLVRTFGKEDIPIFLVPSSTGLGAAVSANLRLAAEESAAVYIEPGTEISGKPYEEAIAEVAAKLTPASPSVALEAPQPQPPSVLVPPPQSGTSETVQIVKSDAAQTPATIYMVPPPSLKAFDPRDTPGPKRRVGRPKKPAFER